MILKKMQSRTVIHISLSIVIFATFLTHVSAVPTLLRGGTFITWDENKSDFDIIANGAMLFDEHILAISGSVNGLDSHPGQKNVIDTVGKIISPGFIDTHRHTWQTAMRTTGPNTALIPYAWTYGSTGPARATFSTEDVYIGELMGTLEGLNAGVTTTVDYAHMTWTREHAEAGLQGVIDSGARVVWCYAVETVVNPGHPFSLNATSETDQLAHIQELAKSNPFGNGLVELGIAFDGFAFGGPISTQVVEVARNFSLGAVTAHYLGSVFGGDGVISDAVAAGGLNTSVPYIFVHGVNITTEEENLLRQFNQFLSITPESEMHYGHTHPHSFLIQDQGSLGVDTHFTFSADILTQMRIWLQSTRLPLYQQEVESGKIPDATPMTVRQAFLMGTRNGGLALRRPDLGVLRVGATADIVVFSTDSIKLVGWSDPIAAIVLHSNVADIDSIYVNGGLVKKDGQLVVDWVGKGFGARLAASAQKWKHTLDTVNITFWRDGIQSLFGLTPAAFGEPFEVDVNRGPTTGYD